jgi:hypothetical protein
MNAGEPEGRELTQPGRADDKPGAHARDREPQGELH